MTQLTFFAGGRGMEMTRSSPDTGEVLRATSPDEHHAVLL